MGLPRICSAAVKNHLLAAPHAAGRISLPERALTPSPAGSMIGESPGMACAAGKTEGGKRGLTPRAAGRATMCI